MNMQVVNKVLRARLIPDYVDQRGYLKLGVVDGRCEEHCHRDLVIV